MQQVFRWAAVGCRRCGTEVKLLEETLEFFHKHTLGPTTGNGGKFRQPRKRLLSTSRRFLSSTSRSENIFKSLKPKENIPVISVSDYMFSRFAKFGDRTALVDDKLGTTYTYSQLEDLARRVGSYLFKKGFRKGDVVCYYGTNNPEFLLLMLGCAATGIILTAANPAYTSGELERHMEHSGSKLLVTVPPLVNNARKANVQNVIVMGKVEGCESFENLLKDDGERFPENVVIDPQEHIFAMPYSSGTTGLPKGVMLSHFNIVANLRQFRRIMSTTTEDNSLAVLPFYHIYGMVPILLGTLQDGGTLVATTSFDPEGFLEAIVKHQIPSLRSEATISKHQSDWLIKYREA